MRLKLLSVVILGLLMVRPAAQTRQTSAMDTMAERYVKLVLALGQHDADYVDAYYGPAEWKLDIDRRKPPLAAIDRDAEQLLSDLGRMNPVAKSSSCCVTNTCGTTRGAACACAHAHGGEAELRRGSRALYDAVRHAPRAYFQGIVNELEPLLPGVAPSSRDTTASARTYHPTRSSRCRFDEAIEECRARTLKHVQLPPTDELHGRVRHQQVMERVQLVPG